METKAPTCDHFQRCVLRSVNKEGPNKGKKFWSCPLDHGRCNFFQWADPTVVSVDGVDAMRTVTTTHSYPSGQQPNVSMRYVENNVQAYPYQNGNQLMPPVQMSYDDLMTLKKVLDKYH
jgi:hypothetical protein